MTQLKTFSWSQIGTDILISEGGFWAYGSGELLPDGSILIYKIFLQGDQFQTCPTHRAWGKRGAEGGNLLRKEGKTIIFI